MDIFYRNRVNAGTLSIFTLPQVRGQANLFFFNVPAPTGPQKMFVPGAIITKISYQQQTNSQFQQSLDNIIYVYSFGDKMGNIAINGMAFPRVCSGNQNGITEVLNFYRQYRISSTVSAVRVTFANEVINGFLVGMSLQTVDTSSGVHAFSLLLRTIPASFGRARLLAASDSTGTSTGEEST